MAIFIPNLPEDFNSSYGEMKVYESFRVLDNNYTIFHSWSWIGTGKQILGEADFVVMHPQKGLLVIEVKSGGIEYKNGEWLQTNTRSGFTKRIDPFIQAKKSQFEIIERLRNKLSRYNTPMVCHCVWFTSIVVPDDALLPAEAPRELILDEKSLDIPNQAVDRAFDFWLNKIRFSTNLDSNQARDVKDVLCPYFHVVPRLKTTAADVEQFYIQLTNQQIALLNFLVEQNTAVIHGLAGTGKTVLAIEKAKTLAEQGKSVLFLCYNSFLKDFLRVNNSMPNVVFHNAHSLAYEIMGSYSVSIDEALNEFENYLEDVFEAEDWHYSNIIVDEGQDLDDRLLNRLYEFVKKKKGCFYVFYDKNQYIMKNQIPEWIDNAECRLVLHKNCRNTAEVFKTSCSILGLEDFSHSNDIHGEIPNAVFYDSEKSLSNIIEKFIKNALDGGLLKEDIVILSATSMVKTWVDKQSLFAGCQLSDTSKDDAILFTTIRKFKGLEAKAILLVDVSLSALTNPEVRRLVYVGCSRAKFILNIAIHEDIESHEIGDCLRQINPSRNVPKNKKGIGRLLNVKMQ